MGYSWALRGQRPQLLSNTGRQRLNVFGAYSPIDQAYVGFETTDNIKAQALLTLINQLEKHQPNGRIILFSANARYNHARCVRDYLQQPDCRVDVVYLPPYSPNLNLIERLWGFMKDRVLKNHYYATFAAFQQAIQHFFAHLQDYANDLQSLMTENFQILNLV
jgi:transposase